MLSSVLCILTRCADSEKQTKRMSFDIFDYSLTLAEIDRAVAALALKMKSSSMRRLDICTMTGNAKVLMGRDEDRLRSVMSADSNDIDALEEVKISIRKLYELSPQMRDKLYTIYRVLGVRVDDFAARLPLCYEGLLTDIDCTKPREVLREIYKKYEQLPLPKYYRWVPAEGSLYFSYGKI